MKAIVLGGTQDHIYLILTLKKKGYTVYLIDYLADPVAKKFADFHIHGSTLNHDFVLEKCIELDAKLCVAFCIDQALLTMAYVSERLGLPCHISFDRAQTLTNKRLMKSIFVAHGIPTSNYKYVSNVKDDISSLNYPLVVKPSDANSSKGIQKIYSYEEYNRAFHTAKQISTSKEVIVEEFIEGIELSVDAFIFDSTIEFIFITESLKDSNHPDRFIINKSVFNKKTHNKYYESVVNIIEQIVSAFEIQSSPLILQLLVNNNGVQVIECSARIGGGSKHHFIKKMTSFDAIDFFLASILGECNNQIMDFNYCNGSITYCYQHSNSNTEIAEVTQLKDRGIIEEVFRYRETKNTQGIPSSSSDRAFGYLITSDSMDELVQQEKLVRDCLANSILQLSDSLDVIMTI